MYDNVPLVFDDFTMEYWDVTLEFGNVLLDYGGVPSTCLFARLESLAWYQQSSATSFSEEIVIYETFVVNGGTSIELLCIAFLEERERVETLWRMKDGLAYNFLPENSPEKPYPRSPITTKAS